MSFSDDDNFSTNYIPKLIRIFFFFFGEFDLLVFCGRVEEEEAGQVPVAYVVRRAAAAATAEEVEEFVGKRVAPYKKLKWVRFIDTIPKSAAGKILRKDLVILAAQAQAQAQQEQRQLSKL